ncbi:MAG: toll/interleukin-1 receptor domain-containing protein [Aequorivita sp.]|nr:toll/interleukin-1 receptor domain-containing protein [Aequorivita sp.]
MSGKKIFISYSRRDTEYVSSLVIALRKQGFEVWFDKNIRTGTDWDDTIEEELKKADALVLILSKTSVASDNVKDEISFAMGLDKPVSPIKIEECDVPMRLARKQFIDFESLGHEVGFERLVKDLNLQFMNEGNVHVPKGTFIPPKQNIQPLYQPRQHKSNNNLLYIIGGIAVGGTLVVFFIIFLVAIFNPQTNDIYDDPYNQDYNYDVTDVTDVTTVEDQDWNTAYSKNNLDGYIAYLYTYGKSAKYYSHAYNEINTFLPKTATVWYGINGGAFNFSKHLYYFGDQTTPPQYDDIITPLFKSELYEGENYVRNGLFVQPGQKLLVYNVWVDVNNNIWAGVRYQL